MPGLAEEAEELRAKVADMAETNAAEKSIPAKRRYEKRPTVVEKRVHCT